MITLRPSAKKHKYLIKYVPVKNRLLEATGTFILTTGLLAPLFLIFLILGVDISRFYMERSHLDRVATQAVLVGSKQLPFQLPVKQTILTYLADELGGSPPPANSSSGILNFSLGNQEKSVRVSLRTSSSSISIVLESQQRLSLLSFLVSQKTIQTKGFASARINPRDVVLFLDSSSYLAPDPFLPAVQAWGSSRNSPIKKLRTNNPQWPAADLYQHILAAKQQLAVSADLKQQLTTLSARVLTQQCFNPALSSHKEAAIRIYDYLSSFSENSVGVLIGPSPDSHRQIETVRGIAPVLSAEQDRGIFLYYRANVPPNAGIVRDEYCLAIANDHQQTHSGYRWPLRRNGSRFHLSNISAQKDFNLSFAAARNLGPRQVIWSKAAHRDYTIQNNILTSTPHYINISKVISRIGRELLSAPYRAERGVLNQDLSALGIILLGDFPWENSTRFISEYDTSQPMPINTVVRQAIETEFGQLNHTAGNMGRRINLYFIVTKHQGNYPPALCRDPGDLVSFESCPSFFAHADSFHDFIKKQNNRWDNLKLNFLRVPDTSSLAQDFLALFPLIDRTTTLNY